MPSPAEIAWLIPVLPLAGACLVGLGLISFNRTVNRLRKPVALLLISCVGAAAVLSFAVLATAGRGRPHRSAVQLGQRRQLQPSDGLPR